MNAPLFLLIFTIIAASVSIPIWIGSKYFKSGRKSQMRERLGTPDEAGSDELRAVTIIQDERRTDWRIRLKTWAMAQVESAGLKWSVSKVLTVCGAFAFIGALAGVRLSHLLPQMAAPFALAVPAVFAALPFAYLARKRRKRISQIEGQLPDALDFMARSLRIGNSFLMTLELLVDESEEPLRSEFRRLTSEIRLGSPMAEPMQKLLQRVPLVDLRMFVSAVLLQRETGGNLGALLTRIGASIRDRFRVRGQVEAAASQAKLSGRVISAMPFVVLGGILVISPGYLQIMTNEPLGRKLLALAAFGQIAGFFIMRKIIRIKV